MSGLPKKWVPVSANRKEEKDHGEHTESEHENPLGRFGQQLEFSGVWINRNTSPTPTRPGSPTPDILSPALSISEDVSHTDTQHNAKPKPTRILYLHGFGSTLISKGLLWLVVHKKKLPNLLFLSLSFSLKSSSSSSLPPALLLKRGMQGRRSTRLITPEAVRNAERYLKRTFNNLQICGQTETHKPVDALMTRSPILDALICWISSC